MSEPIINCIHINKPEQSANTKITWTSGTLKMQILSGKYLGNLYRVKGEMLSTGHFWVSLGTPFTCLQPKERSICSDEQDLIISALRNCLEVEV